jgi:hypothetical protein
MKTGYVSCGRSRPSGEICGADAELVEAKYTYGKSPCRNGQLLDLLQRIDFHVDCPVCGVHWENVPVGGVKAASA